jgi:hypothetical protein
LLRSYILRLGKGALVAITALLWLEEAAEAATSAGGVSPRFDALLDLLTGISSVALIAWICTRYITRAMGIRTTALARFIDATSARAALPVSPHDSGPHQRPHLVEDRDTA